MARCRRFLVSDRIFQLILVDDDAIFRLGLRVALEPFPDLQVVAEADTPTTALEILSSSAGTESALDLVVLELNLGRLYPEQIGRGLPIVEKHQENPKSTDQLTGLSLCQQIKAQYPTLPILLLSFPPTSTQLATAKAIGVDGYCPKGSQISVVVGAMRQLLSGKASTEGEGFFPLSLYPFPIPFSQPTTSSLRPTWHHRQRQAGLGQIDVALAEVASILQNPKLSTLDWLFWSGRRRELQAARWLVNQLLPADIIIVQPMQNTTQVGEDSEEILDLTQNFAVGKERDLSVSGKSYLSSRSLQTLNAPTLSPPRSQQSSLFDTTRTKLQFGIQNLTDSPLEIDILREEKKRELLDIILQKLQEILDELRFSQVQPDQLQQKLPVILRDLWQASTTNFFGKYYTLLLGNREYEIVNILMQDAAIVQEAILNKIPLVFDLFAALLFQMPIIIDNAAYPSDTDEAMQRAEAVLQNLIIQVANAVVQPLLNRLADAEIIKQNFYDRSLISTREIARFRNNLSWKYRLEQYIGEPRTIFESRYNLLVLNANGITKISIYAPRRQELEQLNGIQLAFTLILETRDAIAPRLRTVVSFVGTGVIYILTQVIGRGIGLIGRGIIQGIGNSLQESRYGKNSGRQK
jgi:DNA-binding NarL/FixJ family response regulator